MRSIENIELEKDDMNPIKESKSDDMNPYAIIDGESYREDDINLGIVLLMAEEAEFYNGFKIPNGTYMPSILKISGHACPPPNCEKMFMYSKLEGDLENFDTSLVTDMSYMFYHASEFGFKFDEWNVAKVTNMKFMFSDATSFNTQTNAPWYKDDN